MTLMDRIHRGEAAIADAKNQGRDVRRWEQHLQELKRQAAQFEETTAPYSLSDLRILRNKDDQTRSRSIRSKSSSAGVVSFSERIQGFPFRRSTPIRDQRNCPRSYPRRADTTKSAADRKGQTANTE